MNNERHPIDRKTAIRLAGGRAALRDLIKKNAWHTTKLLALPQGWTELHYSGSSETSIHYWLKGAAEDVKRTLNHLAKNHPAI